MATLATLSAPACLPQRHELQRRLASRFSFLNARSPLSDSPAVPLVERRLFRHFRYQGILSRVCVSALPEDFPSTFTLSAAMATLLGFGGLRAFIYFRMQYIIAAMLGKYVPRSGCRVLDMDIHEGRNLYYYPSDVAEVVAVTDEKNCEVVKNQAIRAGVPVDVKVKAMKTSSLPSNSMDAVVSVYCLCDLKERETKMYLQEAIRLLKPGKPFIFVENVIAEGEFLCTCQLLFHKMLQLFGGKSSLPKDISKVLEEAEGLEKLQYDSVFNFQDPHIVGLALKRIQAANSTSNKRGNKKSVSI